MEAQRGLRDDEVRAARARGAAGVPPPHDDIDCIHRPVTFWEDSGVFAWLAWHGVITSWTVGALAFVAPADDARLSAQIVALCTGGRGF